MYCQVQVFLPEYFMYWLFYPPTPTPPSIPLYRTVSGDIFEGFSRGEKRSLFWYSKCWMTTLNGIPLPFESFVRIKRTVTLKENVDKVKQPTVTWLLPCPRSQTNLLFSGVLPRRFVSIAFSRSLSNRSLCVLVGLFGRERWSSSASAAMATLCCVNGIRPSLPSLCRDRSSVMWRGLVFPCCTKQCQTMSDPG